jgi:hypothetical protein
MCFVKKNFSRLIACYLIYILFTSLRGRAKVTYYFSSFFISVAEPEPQKAALFCGA